MTDNIILKLENLNKIYKAKSEKLHILENLNLEVKTGEMLSIIGKSGSGKSTLLNMIGILDKPDSGSVYYMGKDVSKFSEKERNNFRNSSLGFIFQFHYLLPEFTALENVMIPAMLKNRNVKEVEKRALELLEAVELKERVHHKPSDMSGGEKQRVAITRTMVNAPKLILTNEPTKNAVDAIKTREGFKDMKAVKENNVFAIDNDSSSRPSQNIMKALKQIAKAIYPEKYSNV